MKLAKNIYQKAVVNGEAQRFLAKSTRLPSFESTLKIPRHLIQSLACGIQMANSEEKIHRDIGTLKLKRKS
jgi:hypothetical protein